jgi:hypothetical protein
MGMVSAILAADDLTVRPLIRDLPRTSQKISRDSQPIAPPARLRGDVAGRPRRANNGHPRGHNCLTDNTP